MRLIIALLFGIIVGSVLVIGVWFLVPVRITTTQTITAAQLNNLDLTASERARRLDDLPFSDLVLVLEDGQLVAELRGPVGVADAHSAFDMVAQDDRVRAVPLGTGASIMGLSVQTDRFDSQLVPLIEADIHAILQDTVGESYRVEQVTVRAGEIEVRLSAVVQEIVTSGSL